MKILVSDPLAESGIEKLEAIPKFDVEVNTNLIERFHGTIKSRTKVMRGLHTIDSARLFMDGWLVHYNFFRPHMSLKDMTPAMAAGIRFPFRHWKDVMQQPYEKTARIPVLSTPKPRVKSRRKLLKHRVSKPMAMVQTVRLK